MNTILNSAAGHMPAHSLPIYILLCDTCSFCAELQSSGSTRSPVCSPEPHIFIIYLFWTSQVLDLFFFFLGEELFCFIVSNCILMTGKHLNTAQFANWYGGEELLCVAFLITSYIAVQPSGAGPLAVCLPITYHSNHLNFILWESNKSLLCVSGLCTAGGTED